MKKKIRKRIALCFVVILCFSFMPVSNVFATNNIKENVAEKVQNELEQYFVDFFNTLLTDSEKDFSSTDFSSTNGYIIAKKLVSTRQTYNKLLGGIKSVKVEEVVVNDLTTKNDYMEAMTYVKYTYAYGDCSEENQCTTGSLMRVNLTPSKEGYKVTDMDNTDIETQLVKDALNVSGVKNIKSNYNAIDNYFDEIQDNQDSLMEVLTFSEPIDDGDQDSSPRISVSYDASAARTYAYNLGDNYENYVFKRASLDCTNFVSQCVWAGYGGTSGYTVPTTPSTSNSTCKTLKGKVKSDYRMTSDWYGRNNDSTLGDPPSNFCGVVSFYDYTTSNTGNGPRATGYNNGKVFTSLSTSMRKGDVLQFYNDSSSRYYHSVMVVSTTNYSVSNYSKVKVAQHQSEYNNRDLTELIANFGGSSCKMRLLRFGSTTFSS